MAEQRELPPVHRTSDFVSRHANNARFESYGADLKMLFGQSDLSSGKEVVEQHTAITVSWQEAKIFAYYLLVQLVMYEAQIGQPITVHPILLPDPIPDHGPEGAEDVAHMEETLGIFRELQARLFHR
jgi:hypothetical protein